MRPPSSASGGRSWRRLPPWVGWLPRSRGPSGQALVESPEFLVAVVLDDDAAAASRAGEADLGAERLTEVLLDALEFGIRPTRNGTCRFRLRLAQPSHELFGLADGQLLPHHGVEHAVLQFDGKTSERTPVPFRQPPIGNGCLDAR